LVFTVGAHGFNEVGLGGIYSVMKKTRPKVGNCTRYAIRGFR